MAAVNRPTDVKARDANIEQKLQLFGIYYGFKHKKLPSVCNSSSKPISKRYGERERN